MDREFYLALNSRAYEIISSPEYDPVLAIPPINVPEA